MFKEQFRQTTVFLIIVDVIVYTLSLFFSLKALRDFVFPFLLGRQFEIYPELFIASFVFLILIWVFTNWNYHLYDFNYQGSENLFIRIFKSSLKSYLIFLFFMFFLKQIDNLGSRMFWLFFFINSLLFLYIAKKAALASLTYLMSISQVCKNVAIFGFTLSSKNLVGILKKTKSYYCFAGYFDDSKDSVKGPYLGGFQDIDKAVQEKNIDEIIIALPYTERERIRDIIDKCFKLHIDWKLVPDFLGLPLQETHLIEIEDVPLLTSKKSSLEGLNLVTKIVLDKILAFLCLLLLSPLILFVSAIIKLSSHGPVLFKQRRVGRKGRIFDLYKFRSMRTGAKTSAHEDFMKNYISGKPVVKKTRGIYKLQGDKRITPIGGFIRAFAIDEIPQFINVLKGDMSIVGPRPAIPYELKWYKEWQKERLRVSPGITGLWQVQGRNRLKFDEGVKLDLKYINEWSFSLDFDIMLKTLWVVLFRRER